jgi:hypothetical protein
MVMLVVDLHDSGGDKRYLRWFALSSTFTMRPLSVSSFNLHFYTVVVACFVVCVSAPIH